MDAHESFSSELIALTGLTRTDLKALDTFPTYDHLWADDGIELFWSVWKPEGLKLDMVAEVFVHSQDVPSLPKRLEEQVLNRLVELERTKRITYQPDMDPYDDPDDRFAYDSWNAYAHIAAATAFALKRTQGYSDDVRDCLRRAWQVGSALESKPHHGGNPSFVVSNLALNGLVLLELCHIQQIDGCYEEALTLLAQGVAFLAAATLSVQAPLDEGWENFEEEAKWRGRLKDNLVDFDPNPVAQRAVEVLNHLLNHVRVVNWNRVARTCETLAESWDEVLWKATQPLDSEGSAVPWAIYWLRAQGRAEERMSPNDRRDLLNEREDEAAEQRLRTYFFGEELWEELPERARQSLINADRLWFSTRVGRIESVLNELQIATETLCYYALWQPLRKVETAESFVQFRDRCRELESRRDSPTLKDYSWLCKDQRRHLVSVPPITNLNNDDKAFLTGALPHAFDQLRRLRNATQHDPERQLRRDEINPIISSFVGIGHGGLLPRLARIMASIVPSPKRPLRRRA